MAHVHATMPAEHGKAHHDHWNSVLDQALLRASELGRKGVFDVDVRFWATIEVTNPGRIQAYNVTLSDGS